MKATRIKELLDWRGNAALYQLDPPLEIDGFAFPNVVVSGVITPFSGPETYIFKSDSDGCVQDFAELDGSFRGAINHARALSGLGYTIE